MSSHVSKPPPEICPVCGEDVPPTALACPGCGADYETGWNDEATAGDGLDLPDHDFDYDAYLKREFGDRAPGPVSAAKVWIVALIVIGVCLVLLWLWSRLQGKP